MICELCGEPASALEQGCCSNCIALLAQPFTSNVAVTSPAVAPLVSIPLSTAHGTQARLALVTGGNRGIGRAIVERLLEHGFDVHTIDIDGSNFEQMKNEAARGQCRLTTTLADITDAPTILRVVEDLGRANGSIQVLVNNAGVYHAARLTEHSRASWDRQFAVNVTAAFELCQAVVPWMPVKGDGRIINIASVVGEHGGAFSAAYVASKHAIVGLTRATALDLAPSGINVNAIAPGLVDTQMLRQIVNEIAALAGHAGPEQTLQQLLHQVPQHRLVQPREIAELAVYLASPAAASVTGQVINVSGGWLVS